jgi:uncharacterized protein (DUF2267 family)
MSTWVGLEGIDHSVQLTHVWINELDASLGWENKPRSYRLLRTVLQTLRDWLPVNEAVDLGAQLPTLLRGVYYEHWRLAATPVHPRSKADFMARIDHAFTADPIAVTPEAVAAVFALLSSKITAGEIDDVRHVLPADIRALWPLSSQAA